MKEKIDQHFIYIVVGETNDVWGGFTFYVLHSFVGVFNIFLENLIF